MKIFWAILSFILVGGFIFFRIAEVYIRFKEKQAARRYCEENDLTFIDVVHYAMHSRLYFAKDGIETWANYETDRKNKITWKSESALEKWNRVQANKN